MTYRDQKLIETIEDYLGQDYYTEIMELAPDPRHGTDLLYQIPRKLQVENAGNHVRPMFEVMSPGAGSAHPTTQDGCARCLDFSHSWSCPDHPDDRVMRDGAFRWEDPVTGEAMRGGCTLTQIPNVHPYSTEIQQIEPEPLQVVRDVLADRIRATPAIITYTPPQERAVCTYDDLVEAYRVLRESWNDFPSSA